MEDIERKRPKIHKANYMLQQKVGSGPLDPAAIERMQNAIDTNEVDFTPLGMEYLNQLSEALEHAKDDSVDLGERKERLTGPVMQLKANATIFHYNLIGSLANVMLSFLEAIKELDKDAIDIVKAHHTTLHAIILKKMQGDGGEIGATMVKELKDACARYYKKKKEQK